MANGPVPLVFAREKRVPEKARMRARSNGDFVGDAILSTRRVASPRVASPRVESIRVQTCPANTDSI